MVKIFYKAFWEKGGSELLWECWGGEVDGRLES
jgi:hypothetical protein